MPDRPKPPPAPPLKITTLFGQPVIQSKSGMTQSITPIATEPPRPRLKKRRRKNWMKDRPADD